MAREISLERLRARAPLVDGSRLALVGGSVPAAEVDALLTWLRGTGAGPWWSFGEWTDRMRLGRGLVETLEDPGRLVWARCFGAPGDLEVRRDGARFRWRFVGRVGLGAPAELETDYFAVSAGGAEPPRLRQAPGRTALLWDRRDARVATADAATLAMLPDGDDRRRLQLRFTTYYDHGVVAAVRYRRIESFTTAANQPKEANGGE